AYGEDDPGGAQDEQVCADHAAEDGLPARRARGEGKERKRHAGAPSTGAYCAIACAASAYQPGAQATGEATRRLRSGLVTLRRSSICQRPPRYCRMRAGSLDPHGTGMTLAAIDLARHAVIEASAGT